MEKQQRSSNKWKIIVVEVFFFLLIVLCDPLIVRNSFSLPSGRVHNKTYDFVRFYLFLYILMNFILHIFY